MFDVCSLVNGYAWNNKEREAVELYRAMPADLINEGANVCVLKACSNSLLLDEARAIFDKIPTKTERIYIEMVKTTCSAAHSPIMNMSPSY